MSSYLILKSLHIVGAILFIGNIVVTGWWKAMADRTGEPAIIAYAQRQVTLTDWVFTAGGVLVVLTTGLANVRLMGIPLTTTWVAWGLGLFTLSGVIWLGILVPLQVKLARLTRAFSAGEPVGELYWRLEWQWMFWGVIATLLPLAVVAIMVLKPA